MSTIDEIREGYVINLEERPDLSPSLLIICNNENFKVHIKKFRLEQKIENMTKTINDGDIKDTKLFEEYKNQLKDIKMKIDDILKTVQEELETSWGVIYDLGTKYGGYNEIPEAKDIYKKISASMIKEYVDKLIKSEKKIILFNDSLIELSKKLNINF